MKSALRPWFAGVAFLALACNEDSVTDPVIDPGEAVISSDITTNRRLYKDTVYTISGFIHVADGATLTIDPGTTIMGDYDVVGSSLFVLRGAKIEAIGTAADPIVFTSSRPVGSRMPGDWGGLIIVGNAQINRTSPIILEGTGTGVDNPQVNYAGGTDDADNSGELRYVRVEYAGYATATDAELNSFTLAALGSGTKLSYLQAINGLDDNFEIFGGTVDGKYLVSYEAGDDHFDMSEGYRGRLQFLIAYQSRVLTPRAGAGNVSADPQGIENDGCNGAGCANGHASTPYTIPLIANFTLIGTGAGVVDATSGGIGMVLRRGTGGYYVNGVVARWPRAAFSLRDPGTETRINAGDLVMNNIAIADVGTTFQTGTDRYTMDMAGNAITTIDGNASGLFVGFPASNVASSFDWTPAAGSTLRTGGKATFTGAMSSKGGSVVTGTSFMGAADPNGPKWWVGWTSYSIN
jgi:hypothetical protein